MSKEKDYMTVKPGDWDFGKEDFSIEFFQQIKLSKSIFKKRTWFQLYDKLIKNKIEIKSNESSEYLEKELETKYCSRCINRITCMTFKKKMVLMKAVRCDIKEKNGKENLKYYEEFIITCEKFKKRGFL